MSSTMIWTEDVHGNSQFTWFYYWNGERVDSPGQLMTCTSRRFARVRVWVLRHKQGDPGQVTSTLESITSWIWPMVKRYIVRCTRGRWKKKFQQPQKKKGGRKRQCPALCEVCLRPSAISADVTHAVGVADLAQATEHAEASLFAPFAMVVAVLAPEARLFAPFGQLNLFLRLWLFFWVWVDFGEVLFVHQACSWLVQRDPWVRCIGMYSSSSRLHPWNLSLCLFTAHLCQCWRIGSTRGQRWWYFQGLGTLCRHLQTRDFSGRGRGGDWRTRTNLILPSRGFPKWWKSRACTGHLIEQRERRHRTESKSVKFYFQNKPDDHRR